MADKRQMVQIESLEKYFGEDKERVHVLKGISLNIPEGSLYTFLGPSGCGKTTTLRCVAGLERPERGKIAIDGNPVFASGDRKSTRLNSSHSQISYAVFCLKKKKKQR